MSRAASGDWLNFKCFNCGAHSSFKSFLKTVSPAMYNELVAEEFEQGRQSFVQQYVDNAAAATPRKCWTPTIPKISSLPQGHMALEYVRRRAIPDKLWDSLYYTDSVYDIVRATSTKVSYATLQERQPRLVIPFFGRDGTFLGGQARVLVPDAEPRYITWTANDTACALYGLDRLRPGVVLVTEGPIDAMFLPNGVAACGSDLAAQAAKAGLDKDNTVLVFDNEPRNGEIVRLMLKACRAGWAVFVWPDKMYEAKDINDWILRGWTTHDLLAVISDSWVRGMAGELRIYAWAKCPIRGGPLYASM